MSPLLIGVLLYAGVELRLRDLFRLDLRAFLLLLDLRSVCLASVCATISDAVDRLPTPTSFGNTAEVLSSLWRRSFRLLPRLVLLLSVLFVLRLLRREWLRDLLRLELWVFLCFAEVEDDEEGFLRLSWRLERFLLRLLRLRLRDFFSALLDDDDDADLESESAVLSLAGFESDGFSSVRRDSSCFEFVVLFIFEKNKSLIQVFKHE